MNAKLKKDKQTLRQFMREQYTDGRLVQLLDMARGGQLKFMSCCCFIGIVTENHHADQTLSGGHLAAARRIPGAVEAEDAFMYLSERWFQSDVTRRKLIIPMVLAELRRRGRLASRLAAVPELETVR